MGRKLAALIGILTVAVTFSLGSALASGHNEAPHSSIQHNVLADGQSPNGSTPSPSPTPGQ